ncbi:MAG: DUF1178 family protein [Amylibacter sp.]|nr:DUF1178 family protein [Amylibacter sp.]
MIHYDLKCEKNHIFSSWFNCVDAFDKLEMSNLLSCAVCGSSNVHRAIMAPKVSRSNPKESSPLIGEASSAEQKMLEIRKKLEAEAENVGENFADEARAMHDGDTPMRSIYGEAKIKDAQDLIEDGVPVIPMPWKKRRTN